MWVRIDLIFVITLSKFHHVNYINLHILRLVNDLSYTPIEYIYTINQTHGDDHEEQMRQ